MKPSGFRPGYPWWGRSFIISVPWPNNWPDSPAVTFFPPGSFFLARSCTGRFVHTWARVSTARLHSRGASLDSRPLSQTARTYFPGRCGSSTQPVTPGWSAQQYDLIRTGYGKCLGVHAKAAVNDRREALRDGSGVEQGGRDVSRRAHL